MQTYKKYLIKCNLSTNTIDSYMCTMKIFFAKYNSITRTNLAKYKQYLTENFKPNTVNNRLHGINRYLVFIKKEKMKVKYVKVQQKCFIENVIKKADYQYLKARLKKDGYMDWYFLVWFLGATGARVSELIQIKSEDIVEGYLDLYGKGGKCRRLYIPKTLQTEALEWQRSKNQSSGTIFRNYKGETLSRRGITLRLHQFAEKYHICQDVVYPHSFRHMFAKSFLEKHNEIALLADLLGHESIETTRMYLRKTAGEQRSIVDKVVTW